MDRPTAHMTLEKVYVKLSKVWCDFPLFDKIKRQEPVETGTVDHFGRVSTRFPLDAALVSILYILALLTKILIYSCC